MEREKLDCKVGEIWETNQHGLDKEIIYVAKNSIVAILGNVDDVDDRDGYVYVYDGLGNPINENTIYPLIRKKPEMKIVNYKAFIPLWHRGAGEYTWTGLPRETKCEILWNTEDFVKWIEIDETFEVEDV